MSKYRKKPVVVDAMRLTEDNARDVAEWAANLGDTGIVIVSRRLSVKTLEGRMAARIGDWIIRGTQGEFYPCKPEAFDATFEPVES